MVPARPRLEKMKNVSQPLHWDATHPESEYLGKICHIGVANALVSSLFQHLGPQRTKEHLGFYCFGTQNTKR